MTTREKFLTARDHIRAGELEPARAILETIDHPKAREWLGRIEQLQPTPEPPEPVPTRSGSRRGFYVVSSLVFVVLLVSIAFGVVVLSNNDDAPLGLQEISMPRDYALTEYFPEDTTVFAVMRTDDAQIETLDNLILHIQSFIRSPLTTPFLGEEPVSLTDSLDQMTTLLFQGDFNDVMRSWLGDWVAMGVFNLTLGDDQYPSGANIGTLIVIEIKDKEKTIAFMEQLIAFDSNQTFTRTETNGYTIFNADDWQDNNILINDEVMMIVSDYALTVVPDGFTSSIANSPAFIETMGLLPEDNYSSTLYVDMEPIFRSIFDVTQSLQMQLVEGFANNPDSDMPVPVMPTYEDMLPDGMTMDDVMGSLGHLAAGFTIVDDYTVMVDGVQNPGNMEVLQALSMMPVLTGTIDPTFLRHIPENAGFVQHGTDLNLQIERVLEAEQMQLDILGRNVDLFAQLQTMGFSTLQDEIGRINAIIEPETGLTVMDDIISSMTGDYAMFSTYDPRNKSMLFSYYFPDQELQQNLEAGMVFEITDRDHVQNLIESLGSAIPLILEDVELVVTYETIGGNSAVVVTIPKRDLLTTAVDIVIGVNEDVLVIATRDTATQILEGQGGFDVSSGYASIQPRLLNNNNSMYYISNDGINLIADAMVGLLPPYFDQLSADLNAQMSDMGSDSFGTPPPLVNDEQRRSLPLMIPPMRMILEMFESVTMSVSMDGEYNMVSRFTLTFAD